MAKMPRHPPATEVAVTPRPPVVDPRGEILNVVEAPIGSVARITSVKGAVRANHYHKTDYHFCWLERGAMVYYCRPVGSREPPQRWVFTAGQAFYTPPMVEHMMYFTEDSVFFAFARNPRDMAHYEADTVRIPPLAVEPAP